MRESKGESISRIVKLIEAVHDVAGLLQPQAETSSPSGFQEWLEKMRKTTAQFEFELRTELARVGAEVSSSRHERALNLKSALEHAAECYRQALNRNVPGHTRAMITRQSEEIQKAVKQFRELERAA